MKNNHLVTLLAALAITGGAAYWKYSQRTGAIGRVPLETGTDVLKDFRAADVSSFTIKDSKAEVVIERKDGKWVVPARDGFPASVDAVNALIDNAFSLKVDEQQRAGASQMGTIKLKKPGEGAPEEETGVLVSFRDSAGKDITSLIAGKVLSSDNSPPGGFSMSPQGPKSQYIKVIGVDEYVIKARDGFSNLQTDVKTWLDKAEFIKVEKIKSVTVTGTAPEESWKISRDVESGPLKLENPTPGEEFDPTKATGVGSAFSYVQYVDVLPAADAAKAALEKPVRTAVIETFDGYTFTVKVGAAEGENHYFTYDVDAKFAETRTPTAPKEDGKPAETEEEKKKADEDFAKALEEKKKKLAAQQSNKSRIFIVAKSSLEPILKKRPEYMKDKPAETPAPPAGASVTTLPIEVKPPTAPPKPATIEAVTPPVTIEPTPAPKPPSDAVNPPVATPPAALPTPPPAPPTPPPAPPAPPEPAKEAPPEPAKEAPPAPPVPAPVPAPAEPAKEAPVPPAPAEPAKEVPAVPAPATPEPTPPAVPVAPPAPTEPK